jgi:hypothetical protein
MFIIVSSGERVCKVASECPTLVVKSCHHLVLILRKHISKRNHGLEFNASAK